MTGRVLQRIQLGECYADLLHVEEDGKQHWAVFLLSPRGSRIDTLTNVIRAAGGQFFFLNDKLGLAYDQPHDAQQALERLVELVQEGRGAPQRLLN